MICLSKVAFMGSISGTVVHRDLGSSTWIERTFVYRMEFRVRSRLQYEFTDMKFVLA